MYRTLKIKLDESDELVQTAKLWNAACQAVIDYGFAAHDYNKARLNKATTRISETSILRCPLLCTRPPLTVICSRDFDLRKKPFKHPLGAVRFDVRTMKGKYQYLRSNGKTFKCKSCGFQIDADLNASRNIATFSRSDRSRLPVNQSIVAG